MGTTMTLLEIIKNLENFNIEGTIYAAKPWTENSRALVLFEPESGELPSEAENLGLKYFLEVSIALDFLEDWTVNLNTTPTLQQKYLRLVQYVTNDA